MRDSVNSNIIPNNFTTEQYEREGILQLDLLRHPTERHGNGNTLSFIKYTDGTFLSPSPITDKEAFYLSYKNRSDVNVYVSLNTQCGNRKTNESIYSCSAMYIDIDCHDVEENPFLDNKDSLLDRLQKIADTLNRTYEREQLPIPSFITYTGRGFGIYYLLENAIPWQLRNAHKGQFRFQCVYKGLIQRYEQFLEETSAEVDKKVSDPSRVIRLAGTYNSKANAYCHLIYVRETPYYSTMDEIASYLPNKGFVVVEKTKEPSQKKRYCGATDFVLKRRLERLEKLILLRNGEMIGYRQRICMIAYHTALQIEEYKEAQNTVYHLNQLFSVPLSLSELHSIFRNQKEIYKFRDNTLIDQLSITEEERKALGFGETKRNLCRRMTKEQNMLAREQKYYQILCYLMEHPDATYQVAADFFSCSLRLVKEIVKSYGLSKKQLNTYTKEELTKCYEQRITYNKEVSSVSTKSAEICPLYSEVNKDSIARGKDDVSKGKESTVEYALIPSDYEMIRKANLAEKIAYVEKELNYGDSLFVHWKSLLLQKPSKKAQKEVHHLIKEMTNLGMSRLKKFLEYAYVNCDTEDMEYNLSMVCTYFDVVCMKDLTILPYCPSEKQKEAWEKYFKRNLHIPSSCVNYELIVTL